MDHPPRGQAARARRLRPPRQTREAGSPGWRLKLRRPAERDEVGEQLIGAVNAGRQFAPQPETDVHPLPLAVLRLDERALLHAGVELEWIRDLEQILVARVVIAAEKIQAAF